MAEQRDVTLVLLFIDAAEVGFFTLTTDRVPGPLLVLDLTFISDSVPDLPPPDLTLVFNSDLLLDLPPAMADTEPAIDDEPEDVPLVPLETAALEPAIDEPPTELDPATLDPPLVDVPLTELVPEALELPAIEAPPATEEPPAIDDPAGSEDPPDAIDCPPAIDLLPGLAFTLTFDLVNVLPRDLACDLNRYDLVLDDFGAIDLLFDRPALLPAIDEEPPAEDVPALLDDAPPLAPAMLEPAVLAPPGTELP